MMREEVAPVILSASRSTDIPAFYAKWFFDRLAEGYCVWTNPFNQQKMYVSFRQCKVIVFWTKNPKPICLTCMNWMSEASIIIFR